MSLWAAMKAPLILGNTLAEMPKELYDIVTNPEIIAVNVRRYSFVLPIMRSNPFFFLGIIFSKIH